MSQRREKPKLMALPPPAHKAMQEITFMHRVPEYTAEEITGKGRGRHLSKPQKTKKQNRNCEQKAQTHSSRVCRLCAPTADTVQEFLPQCCDKSKALFSRLWARGGSYWSDLKKKAQVKGTRGKKKMKHGWMFRLTNLSF